MRIRDRGKFCASKTRGLRPAFAKAACLRCAISDIRIERRLRKLSGEHAAIVNIAIARLSLFKKVRIVLAGGGQGPVKVAQVKALPNTEQECVICSSVEVERK